MHYIVQENLFREDNHENLIIGLEKLDLTYEIVKVIPFYDEVEFETDRKDIFPFGSLTMARICKKYGWNPGFMLNDNYDYLVYKDYYKDNLLNYDSKIIKFGDEDFFSEKIFFARPTKDTKVFTGRVFDMEQWRDFRNYSLTNGHSTVLDKDNDIQISTIKQIQQEIRFWIVKGEIVTASQYRLGNRLLFNDIIDSSAYDYCREMIKVFQLNDAFVMDICLCNDEYKIVECGCINCAGFYKADMQKILFAVEENF